MSKIRPSTALLAQLPGAELVKCWPYSKLVDVARAGIEAGMVKNAAEECLRFTVNARAALARELLEMGEGLGYSITLPIEYLNQIAEEGE